MNKLILRRVQISAIAAGCISILVSCNGRPSASTPTPSIAVNSPSNLDANINNLVVELHQQIGRCWGVMISGGEAPTIRVRLYLNPNGTLKKTPAVIDADPSALSNPFYSHVAKAAVQSVVDCAPYRLPAEQYDYWKVVVLTFTPDSDRHFWSCGTEGKCP